MINDEDMKELYEKYKVDVPEATETFEEFKEQTNAIFSILDSHKEEIIELIRGSFKKSSLNLSKWSS